jgi:Ca-activated chloride channel family protein
MAVVALLVGESITWGQGILLPVEESLPAASIVYQRVNVVIREQAAQTRIEQEFRNPTSRAMEAVFLFPVPAGASVDDFAMWVDGKRTSGELIDASQARQIYTDIVRRLRDPGLLERMNDQLFRVRIFPIPPHGTQKIEVAYSQVVTREGGLAEYIYPKSSHSFASGPIEKDFTLRVELESQAKIQNLYSPSHSVGITREGDRRAVVGLEETRSTLNKDFRLLWSLDDRDIGLASVSFRESATEDGYVLLLISPSPSLAATQRVPRDVVFVVDTSGSMAGAKMDQAKQALKSGIEQLDPADRFNVVRFSTTVEAWEEKLVEASPERKSQASQWVSPWEPTGGTAIASALERALSFRSNDGRALTVVFLTDGQPTIGITEPKAILALAKPQDVEPTRLFLFGVGDDVNAPLLDQLADQTRGSTTYVRPNENLEVKVSSFFDKISHPVLTNLKLRLGNEKISLKEVYPPKLPDLFHGGQLVVLARYGGGGATSVMIEGSIGNDVRTMQQEIMLPTEPTAEQSKFEFVASLWGQRKVGYLLDQIRLHGEDKELVEEVTRVAKKFGIVTPYTSYLITPDERVPHLAQSPAEPEHPVRPMPRWSRREMSRIDGVGGGAPSANKGASPAFVDAPFVFKSADEMIPAAPARELAEETGAVAVDVAQRLAEMKNSPRSIDSSRRVAGRLFHLIGGVWVEDGLDATKEILRIKYLSEAYFELVSSGQKIRSILALGPRVVFRGGWGGAVSIEKEGMEKLLPIDREKIQGR